MLPTKNNKVLLVAVIREDECIGCTQCIVACPADAILGSAQQMHTVIANECIGCNLCIAPCPVDCIDMLPAPVQLTSKSIRKQRAAHFRQRYQARVARLQQAKTVSSPCIAPDPASRLAEKKSYIQAALLRTKLKIKDSLA
jgi:electron transport complex protein RnfB